ncbi:hypothetical protein SDC9_198315 [bioreactor metagenome]|uniref:Uncharacterized protein n=1 Tax=bioreactor metagenome TaxID=1076179 RepID=A0A645IU67_9ZZZZ
MHPALLPGRKLAVLLLQQGRQFQRLQHLRLRFVVLPQAKKAQRLTHFHLGGQCGGLQLHPAPPVDLNFTRIGAPQPLHTFQQGGFTRTVGTQQRKGLPLAHLKRNVV